MRLVKRAVLEAVKKTGYKITKVRNKEEVYSNWGILSSNEYEVNTVIDIGVGFGTRELYTSGRFQHLILVEPLNVYEEEIERIIEDYDAKWFKVAASNTVGTADLTYNIQYPEKSSLKERRAGFEREGRKQKEIVEVQTIDNIIESSGLDGTFGIKIDAEGSEMKILEGCQSTLDQTKYVILEAPVVDRFEDSYSLRELTDFMNNKGFYMRDIIDIDNGNIVKFIDFVFYNRKYV